MRASDLLYLLQLNQGFLPVGRSVGPLRSGAEWRGVIRGIEIEDLLRDKGANQR